MANEKQEALKPDVVTPKNDTHKTVKCWNSFSCIASVIIIIFTLGSVLYDLVITKPEIKNSIERIEFNIEKINQRLNSDSVAYNNIMSFEEFQKEAEKK